MTTAVDAVIVAAGGWAGGSVSDDTEAFLASVERMWLFCASSAVAGSHIAAKTLKSGGLLVLFGSKAALDPTPG